MLTIILYNSDEEIFIERRVTTVIDILALAGGFANIIIILARIISKYYEKTSFQQKMISKLF
jgi:hypothetical protein